RDAAIGDLPLAVDADVVVAALRHADRHVARARQLEAQHPLGPHRGAVRVPRVRRARDVEDAQRRHAADEAAEILVDRAHADLEATVGVTAVARRDAPVVALLADGAVDDPVAAGLVARAIRRAAVPA